MPRSFQPPEAVARAAARGLELRRRHGRGGTAVGVARARDLSNRRPVSVRTLKRMRSYFARHAVDAHAPGWRDAEQPSAGWIAWLLWGGDAGRAWAAGQLGKSNPRRDTMNDHAEWALRQVSTPSVAYVHVWKDRRGDYTVSLVTIGGSAVAVDGGLTLEQAQRLAKAVGKRLDGTAVYDDRHRVLVPGWRRAEDGQEHVGSAKSNPRRANMGKRTPFKFHEHPRKGFRSRETGEAPTMAEWQEMVERAHRIIDEWKYRSPEQLEWAARVDPAYYADVVVLGAAFGRKSNPRRRNGVWKDAVVKLVETPKHWEVYVHGTRRGEAPSLSNAREKAAYFLRGAGWQHIYAAQAARDADVRPLTKNPRKVRRRNPDAGYAAAVKRMILGVLLAHPGALSTGSVEFYLGRHGTYPGADLLRVYLQDLHRTGSIESPARGMWQANEATAGTRLNPSRRRR